MLSFKMINDEENARKMREMEGNSISNVVSRFPNVFEIFGVLAHLCGAHSISQSQHLF